MKTIDISWPFSKSSRRYLSDSGNSKKRRKSEKVFAECDINNSRYIIFKEIVARTFLNVKQKTVSELIVSYNILIYFFYRVTTTYTAPDFMRNSKPKPAPHRTLYNI